MIKKSVSEKHEIGHRLKKLRLALSETQQDMANDLNISLSHWSKIEVGAVGLSEGLLYMISHKYGISRDWILQGGPMPEIRSTIFAENGEDYSDSLDENVIRQSGDRIRKLRESLGLTRDELAQNIGIKPGTLKQVELQHQRLGFHPAKALVELVKRRQIALLMQSHENAVESLMDSAIEETYNIMIGGRAWRAIRELSEGLDEDELTSLGNFVKGRIKKHIEPIK